MTKKPHQEPQLTALDQIKLQQVVNSLSLDELCVNFDHLLVFLHFWFGVPNKDTFNSLQSSVPILDTFLDFNIIFKRLANVTKFKSKPFESVSMAKFFPEIVDVRNTLLEAIKNHPPGIQKAVSRLKPIALDAGADIDIEAATYLSCIGLSDLVNTDQIISRWHKAVCLEVTRGKTIGPISPQLEEKAENNTIKLSKAAELLTFNDTLPRFFGSRHEEEEAVDAAFVRAVETYDIKGFEPWVKARIEELSDGPLGGCEPISATWWLFWWSRSDYALRAANRLGLDSWLMAILNSGIEKKAPWRCLNHHLDSRTVIDYITVAGFILFIWHRVQPDSLNGDFLGKAAGVLMASQTRSGGWPALSDSLSPDIMATCAAIHGLCLHKPDGWEKVVEDGANWLMNQQSSDGLWRVSGGPEILITVLVLESIELARMGTRLTFSLGPIDSENNEIKMKEFNYQNEPWHSPKFPETKNIAYDEIASNIADPIAIVVATEVELRQTIRCLVPCEGQKEIVSATHGNSTYYIGMFGKFNTVVVLSSMGAGGISGATLTTANLIENWKPKAVFLIGIAFGIDPKKQQPADVLVATQIIPYELQRRGKDSIFRSPIPASSSMLIDRFRNALAWDFRRPDNTAVKIHTGPILSGDKLIDDQSFKTSLTREFPTAIGGEMEGHGFYTAAEERGVDWIVVKAVCDWADGAKGKQYQEMAAAAAVSLCEHVLQNPNALDGNRKNLGKV